MPREFKLDTKKVNDLLASPSVRAKLRARANSVLPRAQRIALAAGETEFAESLRIEEGTRPGSQSPTGIERPYARIIADTPNAAQVEYGTQSKSGHRIFREASR